MVSVQSHAVSLPTQASVSLTFGDQHKHSPIPFLILGHGISFWKLLGHKQQQKTHSETKCQANHPFFRSCSLYRTAAPTPVKNNNIDNSNGKQRSRQCSRNAAFVFSIDWVRERELSQAPEWGWSGVQGVDLLRLSIASWISWYKWDSPSHPHVSNKLVAIMDKSMIRKQGSKLTKDNTSWL